MDFNSLKKLIQKKLEKLTSQIPQRTESVKHVASESYAHAKESVGHFAEHLTTEHSDKASVPFPQHQKSTSEQVGPDHKLWIDIKSLTIVKVAVIVLLLLYFGQILSQLTEIAVLVLLSVIIAAALGPIVDKWHLRGWNRVLAATVLYLIILAICTLIIALVIPVIGDQIIDLASYITAQAGMIARGGVKELPLIGQLFNDPNSALSHAVSGDQLVQSIQDQIQNLGSGLINLAGNMGKIVGSVFGGLFAFMTVLILSFYMVIQKHSLEELVEMITPPQFKEYVLERTRLVRDKMGSWLRGQIAVCVIVAITAYIGHIIFQVNYALVLAIFAGFMTIIPYIGLGIAAAASTLIAWTDSPFKALLIFIFYCVVILFFEGNFVAPLIMKKAVGLNPITVLIVLLIGGQLYGIMGFVLSIPVATALKIFLLDVHLKERK